MKEGMKTAGLLAFWLAVTAGSIAAGQLASEVVNQRFPPSWSEPAPAFREGPPVAVRTILVTPSPDWGKPDAKPVAIPMSALPKPPAPNRQKVVMAFEPGGLVYEYMIRFEMFAADGTEVEIRGDCLSACTLVMGAVPADHICFGPNARLGFHAARRRDNKPSLADTEWMLARYPSNIHVWLLERGGAKAMTVEKFWYLPARELWGMGYRRCDA
jgi:hypothetical protein